MKRRPAAFHALLWAGIFCACAALLSGCSGEIRIEATGTATGTDWKTIPPWLLQYAPLIRPSEETLPDTLPQGSYPEPTGGYSGPATPDTGIMPPPATLPQPGTVTDPTGPEESAMAKLLSHSSEDAARRADILGWELLDGYVVPPSGQEAGFGALFNPGNDRPTGLFGSDGGEIRFTFDRPVTVYGIELVFEDRWISGGFRFSTDAFDFQMSVHRELMQQRDMIRQDGAYLMSKNTVWLESTDETALFTNLSARDLSSLMYIAVDYGGIRNPLVQINLYGRSAPTVEDPRIPENLPGGWSFVPSYGPGYLEAGYYNEYGECVGTFVQYVPGMEPGIPDGKITREFSMGGISVTQVIHPDSMDLIDLYWSDGSYSYNLSGTHPDLLQLIFRSMGG